ncbi:MAG TPA: hypothetical protein VG269_24885 [Tepidisphaeraceae bacterium]|jgi:hypothetical protein|nr:hypothetical protein [Tepidisphaeraceae bacterium]
MAAFQKLDWTRFDVWAVVAGEGVAVVELQYREACLRWLRNNDYAVTTFDFLHGIGPALISMGEMFRWEEQFGYALKAESRTLNALRDGFEFGIKPGQGVVLELLNAEVAHREDPHWFCGLLSIAHEYSRVQLALGAKFFTVLILPRDSTLVNISYQELSVPYPFSKVNRHADPFSAPTKSELEI